MPKIPSMSSKDLVRLLDIGGQRKLKDKNGVPVVGSLMMFAIYDEAK